MSGTEKEKEGLAQEEEKKEQGQETEKETAGACAEASADEAADKAAEEETAEAAEKAPGDDAEDKSADPAQEDAQAAGTKAENKGGFFKKKEDREKNALQDKIAELEDRVKRQMAEFENFRKRTEREKEQQFAVGERSVIERILPVVDNFERGLSAVPEEEKDGAFANGMEMIYRQLLEQLEALGVKPIEAVGQPFDPNLHNAVLQVDSEDLESGTVAQELQKGYTYRDAVVRHSMVGVVK